MMSPPGICPPLPRLYNVPPTVPQAARTNGAGILQLSRVFDSLAHPPSNDPGGIVTPPVVHLVTFSYNRGGGDGGGGGGGRGGFSPAQPVGSALRQLFWLCSQVFDVYPQTGYLISGGAFVSPFGCCCLCGGDKIKKKTRLVVAEGDDGAGVPVRGRLTFGPLLGHKRSVWFGT